MNTSDSNSGGSERNIAAVIQNDPSRCQFLDISKLPVPLDIIFPQSYRGPYVVLQKGAMPGGYVQQTARLLLTREGRWLPMFAFVKLPDQERFDLSVFSTAAEAMQHLEKLVGRARIDEQRVARGSRGGATVHSSKQTGYVRSHVPELLTQPYVKGKGEVVT